MYNIALAKHELSELSHYMEQNSVPITDYEWGGADLIITSKEPSKEEVHSWHNKSHVYVVTKHSNDLSWLFIQLRDIYYKNNIIDYSSKYGFFCRLGDAAICCIQKHGDNKEKILNSVLFEAFIILEELVPERFVLN